MSGWSAGAKSGLNKTALYACRKYSNTLFADNEDVKDERLLSDVSAFKMLGTPLECGPYGEHSSAILRWLGSQNTEMLKLSPGCSIEKYAAQPHHESEEKTKASSK